MYTDTSPYGECSLPYLSSPRLWVQIPTNSFFTSFVHLVKCESCLIISIKVRKYPPHGRLSTEVPAKKRCYFGLLKRYLNLNMKLLLY